MRKNRFLALQKMAEQKKNEAMNANNAAMNDGGPPDHHGIPKQTVSQFLYPGVPNFVAKQKIALGTLKYTLLYLAQFLSLCAKFFQESFQRKF